MTSYQWKLLRSVLMRLWVMNMKQMRCSEVRNGEIITTNQITTIILAISAGKPTNTPGLKIVSQVRRGNKKKKFPKLP